MPPREFCDAFVPGSTHDDRTELFPDTVVANVLSDGDLVCLRPSAAPPPLTRTLQDHLNTLVHVDGQDRQLIPDRQHRLAAFLGFGFDQFCLQLPFGSVPRFVADTLDIPFESVFLCRQLDPFESLTIAGRCPSQIFGFRNFSDMGRPFAGRGLFIDARLLGRPVCFREILVEEFTPRQLCLWLEVTVPDGFEPFCQGCTPTDSGTRGLTNYHGESVVLWIDATAPAPPPSVDTNVPDDESPDSDDPDDGHMREDERLYALPGSTLIPRERSRSPRPSGTTGAIPGASRDECRRSTDGVLPTSQCLASRALS